MLFCIILKAIWQHKNDIKRLFKECPKLRLKCLNVRVNLTFTHYFVEFCVSDKSTTYMFKTRGRLNNVKTALLLWDGFPKTLDENQYDTITVFQIKWQMLVLKVSVKQQSLKLFFSNIQIQIPASHELHGCTVHRFIR